MCVLYRSVLLLLLLLWLFDELAKFSTVRCQTTCFSFQNKLLDNQGFSVLGSVFVFSFFFVLFVAIPVQQWYLQYCNELSVVDHINEDFLLAYFRQQLHVSKAYLSHDFNFLICG